MNPQIRGGGVSPQRGRGWIDKPRLAGQQKRLIRECYRLQKMPPISIRTTSILQKFLRRKNLKLLAQLFYPELAVEANMCFISKCLANIHRENTGTATGS